MWGWANEEAGEDVESGSGEWWWREVRKGGMREDCEETREKNPAEKKLVEKKGGHSAFPAGRLLSGRKYESGLYARSTRSITSPLPFTARS